MTNIPGIETYNRSNEKFFTKILFVIWLFITANLVLYLHYGAYATALALALGVFVLSPLTFYLNKKQKTLAARILFLASCTFYICSSKLSFSNIADADFYFVPLLLLSLIFFPNERKFNLLFGIGLAVLGWAALKQDFVPFPLSNAENDRFPFLFFMFFHFIGSLFILSIIFQHYLNVSNELLNALKSESKTKSQIYNDQKQILDTINKSAIVAITNLQGKIIFANEHFCKISGYSQSELIGADHRLINSGAHSKEFFKNIWSTIKSGKTWTGEIQNVSKSGQNYWVESAISPLYNDDGQIDRFLAIRFNVTDRIVAQTRLFNSSKMAALGEMASGVAHEINNPLSIIIGRTDLLERKLNTGDLDSVSLAKDIKKINAVAHRIAKIVSGMKSISRSVDDDPKLPTSVNQIMQNVQEICSDKFKSNIIELRIINHTNAEITCRQSQIEQILLNLLCNAEQAIVSLKEKWVQVELHEFADMLRITVTDSGTGIPQEISNKIMLPFYTTKDIGNGTGLGLSISKGIAEDHGGKLYYNENSPNTQFILELPIRDIKLQRSA